MIFQLAQVNSHRRIYHFQKITEIRLLDEFEKIREFTLVKILMVFPQQ